MIEEIQNVEEENKSNLTDNEEFKEAVQAQMRKLHNQGMVVGFQTACHTTLDKIYAFERKPGSKSTNDYKRLIKDVKKFCETGVSRKMNKNGEVETAESETVQN
jgi:hypothetical protein